MILFLGTVAGIILYDVMSQVTEMKRDHHHNTFGPRRIKSSIKIDSTHKIIDLIQDQ